MDDNHSLFAFYCRFLDIKDKILTYRKIHILNKLFNDSLFEFYFFTLILLVGAITVTCTYTGLTYIKLFNSPVEGLVIWGTVTVLVICAVVVLPIAGSCWHASNEAIHSIRSTLPNSRVLQKTLRSVMPFGIRCSPLKALKYKHTSDYFENVINCVITLLLVSKQL